MKKDFKDFSKEECELILNSILKNKKHIDENKTVKFLLELKEIKDDKIEQALKCAEEYYYFISSYFKLTDQEKTFFIIDKLKKFKESELQCCLSVFDPEDQKQVLEHILSLEHFAHSFKFKSDIIPIADFIFDYFVATNQLNTKELLLIYKLLNENKSFLKMINNKK